MTKPFSGPDDQLFVQYKQHFDGIDLSDLHLWQWPEDTTWPPVHGPDSLLVAQAKEARTFLEEHCIRGTFPREDYKELAELCTHFLGGKVWVIRFIRKLVS